MTSEYPDGRTLALIMNNWHNEKDNKWRSQQIWWLGCFRNQLPPNRWSLPFAILLSFVLCWWQKHGLDGKCEDWVAWEIWLWPEKQLVAAAHWVSHCPLSQHNRGGDESIIPKKMALSKPDQLSFQATPCITQKHHPTNNGMWCHTTFFLYMPSNDSQVRTFKRLSWFKKLSENKAILLLHTGRVSKRTIQNTCLVWQT